MNKFWEWMEWKDYSDLEFQKSDEENGGYFAYDDMPKQMLIGYMMEYLNNTMSIKIMFEDFAGTSNDIYDYLKTKIEELNI